MRTKSSFRIFRSQVEQWRDDNHKRIDRAKQVIARETLSRLCARSPVVTGTYCRSHQVGVNKRPTKEVARRSTPVANRLTVISNTLNRGKAKIATAGFKDTIYIGNTAPYAARVEYLGWPQPRWTGRQGPYHVYGLTEEEMRHEAPRIVAKLKNQKMS